jgi:hypothetical protein
MINSPKVPWISSNPASEHILGSYGYKHKKYCCQTQEKHSVMFFTIDNQDA